MRVLTVPSFERSTRTELGDPVEGATTSHVPSSNRAASVLAVAGPHEYFSHLTLPSLVRFCHLSRGVGFITHLLLIAPGDRALWTSCSKDDSRAACPTLHKKKIRPTSAPWVDSSRWLRAGQGRRLQEETTPPIGIGKTRRDLLSCHPRRNLQAT
jgi:hypothetical protein